MNYIEIILIVILVEVTFLVSKAVIEMIDKD